MKGFCGLYGVTTIGLLVSVATASGQEQPVLGERRTLPQAVELRPSIDPDATPEQPAAFPGQQQPAQSMKWKSGAYTIGLGLTEGVYFDDNIYALTQNRVGDTILMTRPEAAISFRSEQTQSVAQIAVEDRRYKKFSGEDNTNVATSLGTTWRPQSDIQIQSRLGYQLLHEQRGTSDSTLYLTDRPIALNQYDAALIFNKRFDGWWTSLGGANTTYHYRDPTIQGFTIDQSYRNGNVTVATGRIGKVVAPLTSLFLEASGNWRQFDVSGFNSSGYRTVIGLMFEPGPGARAKGEFYAGYMNQNYVWPTFIDFSTLSYGGNVALRVAPGVTTTIEGRREAKETLLNGGGSVLESVIGTRTDVQLTEKFSIGAGLTFLDQWYAGNNRTDRTLGPLVAAKFSFNPNITLGAEYRHAMFRSINNGIGTYERNIFLVTLSGRI